MNEFPIRYVSNIKDGYLMGHTYDSLVFIYGGTFMDCFEKYVEWYHGEGQHVFCKALSSMTTLSEVLELYENYFQERVEVLIKCRQDDIIKSDYIDQINLAQ